MEPLPFHRPIVFAYMPSHHAFDHQNVTPEPTKYVNFCTNRVTSFFVIKTRRGWHHASMNSGFSRKIPVGSALQAVAGRASDKATS